MFLISLPLGAQEMRWENVTALNFAATNGTDKENALQHRGYMDGNLRVVIPMKYQSIWDGHDNVIEMLRFDKMLDVYDATTFKFLRTKPKPHD